MAIKFAELRYFKEISTYNSSPIVYAYWVLIEGIPVSVTSKIFVASVHSLQLWGSRCPSFHYVGEVFQCNPSR